MKLKAISGIMLTLLLASILMLVFNAQPAKANATIYIRDDGSIDPPTANITSADKITYTFTGNVNDAIVVERNNIVLDGVGYTLQGKGAAMSIGISLSGRSNVTIKNIRVSAFYYGIYLSNFSNYNSITGNNITNNSYYGIYLYDSSNNVIFHNNFINNTQQAYIELGPEPTINVWDDCYPSGGNYWSDYLGIDVCSGPYQNETGSDGTGDTPYVIDGNNLDRYPVMNSYQPVSFNATKNGETYTITAVSNSTITNFSFSYPLQKLSFNVTGPSNITGYCNIILPKDLINGTIVVLVNSNPVDYNMEENATHFFIYFTYSHSTSFIEILTTIPGDINGDRTVDKYDLGEFAVAYNTHKGDPKWNQRADLTGDTPGSPPDDDVDKYDLAIFTENYRKSWR